MDGTFGPATAKSLIPHRYPILLVDRVVEVVAGERITTLKAVTCNEPWYQGIAEEATDDDYSYPTALLIESWCQSAALLGAHGAAQDTEEHDAQDTEAEGVVLFGGMSDVTVHGRAYPGDVVRHEVTLTQKAAGATFFEGTSSVAGKPLLTVGQAVTLVRPASSLEAAPAR
ncbi:3-hydroxyacyl-ACP dehydratase FabZ family protein [Streptomyces sp. NPDC048416]|uniref:3-hydroxyacyl-ACP dehydratase FabZ family protein n=1 Tax=Streptomyces sp. NPDC048416 TaxID=3365546 RepID=UPI00371D2589